GTGQRRGRRSTAAMLAREGTIVNARDQRHERPAKSEAIRPQVARHCRRVVGHGVGRSRGAGTLTATRAPGTRDQQQGTGQRLTDQDRSPSLGSAWGQAPSRGRNIVTRETTCTLRKAAHFHGAQEAASFLAALRTLAAISSVSTRRARASTAIWCR